MKRKKVIKALLLFSATAIALVVVFCLSGYAIITRNSSLNKDNFNYISQKQSIYTSTANTIEIESGYASIDELNEWTINAFIAKEDKRFYSHKGFDIIRIFGALKNNLFNHSGGLEGGSTISQQLIKNTHTDGERTIKRKVIELKLSRQLEKNYSKEQILEMYLNSIYFGNNCYGIESASVLYFNKSASDLSLAESSILAGLISAPNKCNPISNPQSAKARAKTVLKLMLDQDYITQEDYANACNEVDTMTYDADAYAKNAYNFYAISEACEILGIDNISQISGNIKIETYLDNNIQSSIYNKINSGDYTKSNDNDIMPDIACVMTDNTTGGIVGFYGKSACDLLKLRQQPASTIKPLLVYAPAFEYLNYVPCSLILDEPINIDGYSPSNATKLYYGYTSIRDNIVRSTNIPAVKILNELGVENAKSFASKMGITFNELDNGLALALGGFTDGVTLCELAGGYMCLANYGNYIKPTFIKSITVNNKVVYSHQNTFDKVMSESTAFLITDTLKDVASYGTGRKIKSVGSYIASKTGSNVANEINNDAWNVSYTTQNTCVCWVGNTYGEKGSMHETINGSTYPTLLVKDVFSELYHNNEPSDFYVPSSVAYYKIDKDIYNNEHEIVQADDNSSNTFIDIFKIDNPPQVAQLQEQKEITLIQELLKNKGYYNFKYRII